MRSRDGVVEMIERVTTNRVAGMNQQVQAKQAYQQLETAAAQAREQHERELRNMEYVAQQYYSEAQTQGINA